MHMQAANWRLTQAWNRWRAIALSDRALKERVRSRIEKVVARFDEGRMVQVCKRLAMLAWVEKAKNQRKKITSSSYQFTSTFEEDRYYMGDKPSRLYALSGSLSSSILDARGEMSLSRRVLLCARTYASALMGCQNFQVRLCLLINQ